MWLVGLLYSFFLARIMVVKDAKRYNITVAIDTFYEFISCLLGVACPIHLAQQIGILHDFSDLMQITCPQAVNLDFFLVVSGLEPKDFLLYSLDTTFFTAPICSVQFTLLTFGSRSCRPSLSFSVGLSSKTSSTLSDSESPSPAHAMRPRPT